MNACSGFSSIKKIGSSCVEYELANDVFRTVYMTTIAILFKSCHLLLFLT